MNKRILYTILSALFLVTFVACTNEDDPTASMQQGEIRFSVEDGTQVEVETKAITGLDVNDFNVALSHNDQWIFSSRKYKDIVGNILRCDAGTGYVATAESCTEGEAERANSNWGQVRVAGREEFEVQPLVSKTVNIECALANSSVSVDFSPFVKKTFESYSITMYAADAPDRSFTFNQNNHSYRTAYFNVGAEKRALQYTASFTLPGARESNTHSATLTLEPSTSYHITVKLKDESQSKLSIEISVDGEIVEEKVLDELINPYE